MRARKVQFVESIQVQVVSKREIKNKNKKTFPRADNGHAQITTSEWFRLIKCGEVQIN
jgi:hypothetical protein